MAWGGDCLTMYDFADEAGEEPEEELEARVVPMPPSRAARLLDSVSDLELDEGVA